MSAIFGVVGPASPDELEMMAERLAHKGRYRYSWSPDTDVWLGEIRDDPRQDGEHDDLAFAGQLYVRWPDVAGSASMTVEERAAYQRRLVRAALERRTEQLVDSLDGHFGIAWWQRDERRLVLAVDRVNYQRIYYVRTSDRIFFSSEYKALLAFPDVDRKVDMATLQRSIATFRPNFDGSRFAAIRRVRYGHYVAIDRHGEHRHRYFTPVSRPGPGSLAQYAEALRELLIRQARAWHSHHDRIAITLSGGLDSVGLLGVLRSTFPDKHIASYTIGTGEDDPEIIGARAGAAQFGTLHHEYRFDPRSLPADLPKLVWLTEEYAAREEAVLQYQLESIILGREKVLTAGHGADMMFLGMPRYRLVHMAEKIPPLRTAFAELYQQTQSGVRPSSAMGRCLSQLAYRGSAVLPPRLAGTVGPSRVSDETRVADMVCRRIGSFRPYQYHAAIYSLEPIEIAMPFLSNAMLDFALAVPDRYKLDFRRQKIVLREALAPFLPETMRRRGKAIQRAKRTTELSDVLDEMASDLLSPAAVRDRGLVEPGYVSRIRRRPGSGIYSGDQLSRLWMLLCTELWYRAFVDLDGEPPGMRKAGLKAGTLAPLHEPPAGADPQGDRL